MTVSAENKEIIKQLKEQLKSIVPSVDESSLENLLKLSLSAFNTYHVCTYFSFADMEFCDCFSNALVFYAAFLAILAKDHQKANYFLERWQDSVKIKESESFKTEWMDDE